MEVLCVFLKWHKMGGDIWCKSEVEMCKRAVNYATAN